MLMGVQTQLGCVQMINSCVCKIWTQQSLQDARLFVFLNCCFPTNQVLIVEIFHMHWACTEFPKFSCITSHHTIAERNITYTQPPERKGMSSYKSLFPVLSCQCSNDTVVFIFSSIWRRKKITSLVRIRQVDFSVRGWIISLCNVTP